MFRPLTTVLVTLAVSVLALGSPLCCIVDVGCCAGQATPEVDATPRCPNCCLPAPEPDSDPQPTPRKCGWCDHPDDLSLAQKPEAPQPLLAVVAADAPVVRDLVVLTGIATDETTAPPRVEPARNLPLLL